MTGRRILIRLRSRGKIPKSEFQKCRLRRGGEGGI